MGAAPSTVGLCSCVAPVMSVPVPVPNDVLMWDRTSQSNVFQALTELERIRTRDQMAGHAVTSLAAFYDVETRRPPSQVDVVHVR